MAPVDFVQKKSGEIHLWVDYHEPNKKTQKDACPSLLPDEVQLDQQFSPALTYIQEIGNFLFTQITASKQLFVQGQVWGYFSSNVCHLA